MLVEQGQGVPRRRDRTARQACLRLPEHDAAAGDPLGRLLYVACRADEVDVTPAKSQKLDASHPGQDRETHEGPDRCGVGGTHDRPRPVGLRGWLTFQVPKTLKKGWVVYADTLFAFTVK
jgi:hypothetical protein